MLDPKTFDELTRKFSENLPAGLREFQREVEQNMKSMVQSTLHRMELVTREEFDAQAKVLARTRAQLDAMEARLAALEGNEAATSVSEG